MKKFLPNYMKLIFLLSIFIIFLIFSDKNEIKIIKKPQFNIFEFKESIAKSEKNGKYGYINQKGEPFIDFKFDMAGDFKNNRAIVLKDNVVGVIDSKEDIIIPFKFNSIERFDNLFFVSTEKGKGVINLDGNELIETKYQLITPNFNKLYCFLNNEIIDLYSFDGKFIETIEIGTKKILGEELYLDFKNNSLFHKEKNIKIPGNYVDSNNFFLVYEEFGKFGLISLKTLEITEPIYEKITLFNTHAKIKFNGKYSVLDQELKKIFKNEYDEIYPENLEAILAKIGENYGYIDSEENVLIPFKYKKLSSFYKDIVIYEKNGGYGLIDNVGNEITDKLYSSVNGVNDDFILVGDETGIGAITKKGKVIIETLYDNIFFFGSKHLAAMNNKELIIFDSNGDIKITLDRKVIEVIYPNQINTQNEIIIAN